MNQDWEQSIEQIFLSESPVWLEHRFSGGSLITYALVRPTLKNTQILVFRADFVNQPLDQLKSQIVQKSQTCWFFFFFKFSCKFWENSILCLVMTNNKISLQELKSLNGV